MRQKRAKSYKKQMSVYTNTFKFRTPFQVIIDPEILITTNSQSFDILKGLARTIQSESKPMITQCCIELIYQTKNQELIDFAKSFERRKCNHKEIINPSDCIELIVNINGENKHRYIIASQDLNLRKKLRKIPGIPLIYMNRSVMVMEPLSDASKKYNENIENLKLTAGLNSKDAGKLDEIKNIQEKIGENGDDVKKSKKRKGPKEPNPLSVKKKKKVVNNDESQEKKKKPNRRRKHKKSGDGDDNEDDGKDEKIGQVESKPEEEIESRPEAEVESKVDVENSE